MKLGVDVSRWQGAIDWPRLASQGVLWSGIRASIGNYYTDPKFETNYDQAAAAGILPFPYHVVNPDNAVAGQLDRYRLSLGGRKPVMSVIDGELAGRVSNTILRRRYVWFYREGRTDTAFGSQWIMYTNKNFADNHLKSGYMGFYWDGEIPLWVASYGSNDGEVPSSPPFPRLPGAWDRWYAWQYTDKGKLIGGSSADIDQNLMDDDFYNNLRARSGIPEPGGAPSEPARGPVEPVTVLSAGLYRVAP